MINFNKQHLPKGINSWIEYYVDSFIKNNQKFVKMKKVIVSDCDGIITTSQSLYNSLGKFGKVYGAYDKEIINIMKRLGWKFIFCSSDSAGFNITSSRITHLNKDNDIELTDMNSTQRYNYVKNLVDKRLYNIVCFIGDSLSDIDTLNIADFAATTNNAPDEVKKYCDVISELNGGMGGFADILFNLNEYISRSV